MRKKKKFYAPRHTVGIALPFDLHEKGKKRATALQLTFSKYVQRLITEDIKK